MANIPDLPEMSELARQFQHQLWAARGSLSLAPPPADQVDAWRAQINTAFRQPSDIIAAYGHDVIEEKLGTVDVVRIRPRARDDVAALHFHGGGYVVGEAQDGIVHELAAALGAEVISVEYRKAPAFPYPAALEDALAAYGALLKERGPGQVAFTGSSAGAGLALLTALAARDRGWPLPAALVALSPWVDLSETGDSLVHISPNLEPLGAYAQIGLADAARAFAAGRDLRDPSVSPLYADYSAGFCPVMLSSGTRDWFLSGCAQLQRRLRRSGIPVDMQLWDGFGHALEGHGLPESAECLRYVAEFIRNYTRS